MNTPKRYVPTRDELEDLFVNNADMDRVAAFLNCFNPIRTMRMQSMEIRHSAILAWLLDPRETHGLADRFLKALLAEALKGHSANGSPTALDVVENDLRDADVRREWQHIDIFIHLPRLGWAFIIENKWNATQSEGQLSRYMEEVKRAFHSDEGELLVRGIFLTLWDEEPQDPAYAPIGYAAICELLPRLIAELDQTLSAEVKIFMQHYLEIIKDEAGMSDEFDEMEKLARQLYRNHQKVLDFVMEHGASSDFATASRALFGDGADKYDIVKLSSHEYCFNSLNNNSVSFIPRGWTDLLDAKGDIWPGCESWWAGYPLIVWVELWTGESPPEGQLRIYAEVGPLTNYPFRKALIEAIQKTALSHQVERIAFQRGAAEEGRQYSKFLKKNSLKLKDISDADEIAAALKSLLAKFQAEFDVVENALKQVLDSADLST